MKLFIIVLIVLTIIFLSYCIYKNINKSDYLNFYTDFEDYRIGDIFYERLDDKKIMIEEKINSLYPDSLASLYLKNKKQQFDYKTLLDLIEKKYINKNINKNNVNSYTAVVHLRLGDILDDKFYENNKEKINQKLYDNIPNDDDPFPEMITVKINGVEKKRVNNSNFYLKSINFYKRIIKKLKEHKVKYIILMSGSHIKCQNYNLSNYVFKIIKKLFESNGFKVQSQIANSPDLDIYFTLYNKFFVPGKGGYASLLKDLAHKKGLVVLE